MKKRTEMDRPTTLSRPRTLDGGKRRVGIIGVAREAFVAAQVEDDAELKGCLFLRPPDKIRM